jgi:hypothetical protein
VVPWAVGFLSLHHLLFWYGVRESKDPDLRMVVLADDLFGENLWGRSHTLHPSSYYQGQPVSVLPGERQPAGCLALLVAREAHHHTPLRLSRRILAAWRFEVASRGAAAWYSVRLVPHPDAGRDLA